MKLSDLSNNQVVTYRLGRAGRENVEWQPWTTGPIYLQRRQTAFKGHPANEILTLTPINEAWAEYGENDYCSSFNCFLAEDWYMEIKDLTI